MFGTLLLYEQHDMRFGLFTKALSHIANATSHTRKRWPK